MAIVATYTIYGFEVEVSAIYNHDYKNGEEPEFYDLFVDGQCINSGSPIYPSELDKDDAHDDKTEGGRPVPSESFVREFYSDLLLDWCIGEAEGTSFGELNREHKQLLDTLRDDFIMKIRNDEAEDESVRLFFELYHAAMNEI